MEEKKYTFLLEVIYNQAYSDSNGSLRTELARHALAFSENNKDKAKFAAKKEADRIVRYGLTAKGGSIVQMTILPTQICQVGIVDLELKRKEDEEMALAKAEADAQAEAAMNTELLPAEEPVEDPAPVTPDGAGAE